MLNIVEGYEAVLTSRLSFETIPDWFYVIWTVSKGSEVALYKKKIETILDNIKIFETYFSL